MAKLPDFEGLAIVAQGRRDTLVRGAAADLKLHPPSPGGLGRKGVLGRMPKRANRLD